jgi:hypothetical protein
VLGWVFMKDLVAMLLFGMIVALLHANAQAGSGTQNETNLGRALRSVGTLMVRRSVTHAWTPARHTQSPVGCHRANATRLRTASSDREFEHRDPQVSLDQRTR